MREAWRALIKAMDASRSATSAEVLPSRVIFLFTMEERERVGSLKGGRRRPGLGDMSSFWFSGGICRSLEMVLERSEIVDEEAKSRAIGLP